jgi:Flp pilus assembly protein TadD
MAKQSGKASAAPKKRAKAVLRPREKKAPAEPVQSRPHTVDPEKLELWRSLPEDQRIALREREAARMFNNAAGLHREGKLDDAIEAYGKSLLLNPKQPDVYNNMGVALRSQGKLEAAVACYRRSLVLKPNNSGVYSNMGNALRELGRLEVSMASHQQAVRLAPRSTEAYYNLGLVLRDLGQTEAALSCLDKALALNENHVDCQWDRALTLLEMGRLEEGFEAYESRWLLDRSPPRTFDQPRWDGADLKGKTVLVHHEQGFGDMIQFARYLPMIKARGGQVVVEVQPELARLMGSVEGVSKVFNRGQTPPKFDFWIPMMSLPHIFATSLDSIPAEVPYVGPLDPGAVQLPSSLGRIKRVGISWAGRPTHRNDANRSAGFKHFIEIMGLPGMSVYSLQKGPAAADIKEFGCDALVTDLGERLRDFSDTAAVVSQLDLVITVDTALAHLAGAMGKAVWVAVPFSPDWRWMRGTDSSPWYPSMRLFRQKRHGAWAGVFGDIRRALRDEIVDR